MDFRAVSDTHRFGIFVPDEIPPGNQVTTRVEKLPLLSHRRQRFALMLTPRRHPGEIVSPRILRHAPACYILVTMGCSRRVGLAAFFRHFSGLRFILVSSRVSSRPLAANANRSAETINIQNNLLLWMFTFVNSENSLDSFRRSRDTRKRKREKFDQLEN